MKAIKDTGHTLLASVDKHDSVGVMDSYFPESAFFTEFERFDRHVEKLKKNGQPIHYFSICSPNYLHDAHIRFALRYGANVICEKPLVLNPWNIEAIEELEQATGKKVFTILQLRLHPSIIALKQKVETSAQDKIFDFDLTYITSRGHWYYTSWKGDISKSGGIATNIGVHFFDMLSWVFGEVEENIMHIHTHDRAAGFLKFKKANVKWFLSINTDTLPASIKEKGQRTYRSMTIDGEEIEFSDGFTELHTESYKHILTGQGFGVNDSKAAIEIVHHIRTMETKGIDKYAHYMASMPLTKHPFQK
jgi:UDP-N-acetyl-2-amino-2-deoxyglucuronate dehydrogenase